MQIAYGGDPERWFHIPYFLLEAYVLALPKRTAEQNLTSATVMGVGAGNLDKQSRRRIIREWERAAGYKREGEKFSLREPDPKQLSRLGIKVIRG